MREHRHFIVLLFIFSCLATHLTFSSSVASGFAENFIPSSGSITNEVISEISGAFAPLIGVSSSPFVALTILSGMGTLLNSGMIDPANIPFSNILAQLPISQMGVFVCLLIITLAKFLLSMLGTTKIFSDATLGKLENLLGTVIAISGAFLISSISAVSAAEITASSMVSGNAGAFLLTNIISFFMAVLAYVVYVVMKTMVAALDALAYLVSPIPGSTAFFTVIKYLVIAAYTWFALVNPIAASIIGIICLLAAFLVFRGARRLELYYRKIYLIPFTNALFRRSFVPPLMPEKLPYSLAKEFNNIEICIEGFSMNKTSLLHKRELCYFVRADGVNYIFKKRLLGKTVKFEILGDAYIENSFRYVRIFTDKGSHIDLVMRREHSKNIAALIEKAGLIDM